MKQTSWKRRITSNYAWPTKYLGERLRLTPGVNRVEEQLLAEAKTKDPRLSSQIMAGKVVDGGYQVDWIRDQLKADPTALTALEVNAIGIDEARALVKQFTANHAALARLADLAERGGISRVFRSALEGVAA